MKRFVFILAAMILLPIGSLSAAEYMVSQKDRKFIPGELRIKVGDTLTFVNAEKRRRHNVYSKSSDFDYVNIRKQKPGDKDSVVIKNAGTLELRCALHPKMAMMVYVSP